MKIASLPSLSAPLHRSFERAPDEFTQRRGFADELFENCRAWSAALVDVFDEALFRWKTEGPEAARQEIVEQDQEFLKLNYWSLQSSSPIIRFLREDKRFVPFAEACAEFYKSALSIKRLAYGEIEEAPGRSVSMHKDGIDKVVERWHDEVGRKLGAVTQEHMRMQVIGSKPRLRRIAPALIVLLALAGVGLFLLNRNVLSVDRSNFEITSKYLGAGTHAKPLAVVFVHGIFGSSRDTWVNKDSSFPELLAGDPEFKDRLDVFLFEYFSPRFGKASSIGNVAEQLRGALDDYRVFEDHQQVVFLSHSMGGIIVRQFLLNRRDHLPQIPMLYFYATPTNGSELTVAAREISNNPQLRGMLPLEGNDLLQVIQSGWMNWPEVKSVPSYCAFETLPTAGVEVVSESSATALCNQAFDPMAYNHIDIVKPRDRKDARYTRFAFALRTSALSLRVDTKTVSAPATPTQRFHPIRFDVWHSLTRGEQDRNHVILSHDFLAVVIYGQKDLDVNQIDIGSVRVTDGKGSGTGATMYYLNPAYDENGDGIPDLKLDFRVADVLSHGDLDRASTHLNVKGQTRSRELLRGSQAIHVAQ